MISKLQIHSVKIPNIRMTYSVWHTILFEHPLHHLTYSVKLEQE